MPNHFTVIGLCGRVQEPEQESPDRHDFQKTADFLEEGGHAPDHVIREIRALAEIANLDENLRPLVKANLCELASPSPEDQGDWYQWRMANWGTKWGTYDTKVSQLSGDGWPVLIEFQCAWGPPHAEAMRKIEDYLREKHFMESFRWIGFNPYDDSTCDIEVTEAATPPRSEA